MINSEAQDLWLYFQRWSFSQWLNRFVWILFERTCVFVNYACVSYPSPSEGLVSSTWNRIPNSWIIISLICFLLCNCYVTIIKHLSSYKLYSLDRNITHIKAHILLQLSYNALWDTICVVAHLMYLYTNLK